MKKVGFSKSIHLKFILIYVLLILIAMQVIGVYFIRQLEEHLVENFRDSVYERARLLGYNVEQELTIEQDEPDKFKQNINQLLRDFVSEDITEVQVIDFKSRVIATSDPYNQGIIGKRTTDRRVKHALLFGTESEKILIDESSGHRIFVIALPLKSEEDISGAVYLISSLEKVYEQMREINGILAAGTGIALGITAILGIFLARTITRPMADMRKQALVMAEGDFSRKVQVYGDDEIGQLAMTFNDLTKKLEEAQAMTEGERRKLSSVLTNMTDGVIAADNKGKIILMNDPAAIMLDVSRETVIGQPMLELLRLDDTLTISNLFESTETRLLDFSEDETNMILKASFSVIQKDEGYPNGIITVLHDVTEQEKIEEDRKEFVANVSHELRTPLTTMRSYLEALAEGAWRDESIAPRFLHVTQNETERMIRLVSDLLQLSKLDSKDYKLTKEYINIVELFHNVIDRFEMSKDQNVSFERNLPKDQIEMYIDEDKITQLLDNVISNALKYSPEGGTVVFSLKANKGEISITIKDNGVGIPKENLSKIFHRFYRVDKARSRKLGGTGLGLAIAKEIVEIHGGQIWAESEEGEGTTVSFTLPFDEWEGELI
jgi:two-component system sensor histidine kinase VicK